MVLLAALMGGVRMPWGLPGALAAVLAGTLVFWGRWALAAAAGTPGPHPAITLGALGLALPLPTLAWLDALDATLPYLPIALPFAMATVVGGIDNTESAAAAGDEYRARDILLTEAIATMVAGFCGGVMQNTPYIGHPAYKQMGARAGYTLATGLADRARRAVGVVAVLVRLLPKAAVAPILVFIGLEITAQAFQASPPAPRSGGRAHLRARVAAAGPDPGRPAARRARQERRPTSRGDAGSGGTPSWCSATASS